jgi:hypothetical protein
MYSEDKLAIFLEDQYNMQPFKYGLYINHSEYYNQGT